MGHTFGEIKMPSHYVMALFALMSSCVATTGKLLNIDFTFIIFFQIYFSSVSCLEEFRKCEV